MTVADKARRMHRKFAVTILPGLSEEEQLQFINERRLKDGVNALSLASAANSTPEMISLTAEWLLNLKSLRSAVLADRARISRSAGSPELRKLVDELVLQRAKLAALMLHPDTKKDAKSLVDDLFSLQRSVDELNRSISKFDAKGDSETKWADIDSIRKAIPAKSILVEFGRMDRCDYSKPASELPRAEYGAWIIPAAGGGDIKFFNLGSATYVELAVIHARRHLAQSMANADVKSSEAAARKALTPLSQTLLRPLAAAISDAEKVIISPDGALWMVPWPALIDSDNNYLIEKYSVSLVGTGRDLLNKAPTKGISTGVIVADPDYDVGTTDAAAAKPFRRLPGTAREAKEVALHLKKIAGGDPTVLMGAAASEVAVKELHNVSVLVLSTHGFYLPIPASAKLNPLLCCGLALKGANHRGLVSTDDDGILTGMEVVGINLEGTKLVVLSACDTGVGQLQVGEGVAGLRQAFQLAGAEAVVASLWPVADEETATLMGRFFKHQATSRQYADALRQAQLEFMDSLKRERGAAHPILWAAFSVMSATP